MEEKVTLIFSDGTEISADVNGTCYIADTKPTFPDDLSVVTIEAEGETKELYNVSVQEAAPVDNRYWFVLIEATPEELHAMEVEAQTFYTAMMTDTLIEED